MAKPASYLAILILISLFLGLGMQLFQSKDRHLHLRFYDVGQGDALLIKTPDGYRILIDGGPNNKVLEHLGKDLGPVDRRIDFVILTHPQADHMAGLIEVIKRYEVGQVLVSGVENTTEMYQRWSEALKSKGLQPKIVFQGEKLNFPDGVQINFLWPKEEHPIVADLNSASLVMRLDFGEFNAELTGDADSQVQPYTTSTSEVEVLKVPHHGSKTALNPTYISQISPEVSIISAGQNNRYGHPHSELLKLLSKFTNKIYRTDQNGTIEVVSDGKSWYTRPEKGN